MAMAFININGIAVYYVSDPMTITESNLNLIDLQTVF